MFSVVNFLHHVNKCCDCTPAKMFNLKCSYFRQRIRFASLYGQAPYQANYHDTKREREKNNQTVEIVITFYNSEDVMCNSKGISLTDIYTIAMNTSFFDLQVIKNLTAKMVEFISLFARSALKV